MSEPTDSNRLEEATGEAPASTDRVRVVIVALAVAVISVPTVAAVAVVR